MENVIEQFQRLNDTVMPRANRRKDRLIKRFFGKAAPEFLGDGPCRPDSSRTRHSLRSVHPDAAPDFGRGGPDAITSSV